MPTMRTFELAIFFIAAHVRSKLSVVIRTLVTKDVTAVSARASRGGERQNSQLARVKALYPVLAHLIQLTELAPHHQLYCQPMIMTFKTHSSHPRRGRPPLQTPSRKRGVVGSGGKGCGGEWIPGVLLNKRT
jgi:hypothetical protein